MPDVAPLSSLFGQISPRDMDMIVVGGTVVAGIWLCVGVAWVWVKWIGDDD